MQPYTVRPSQRSRLTGLGTAAAAFAALTAAPLAAPPAASADVFDEVADQIFAPFLDASTSAVDWDAVLDPTAWGTFLDTAHWDEVFAGLETAAANAAPATDPPDWSAMAQQYLYVPIHTVVENWINSDGPTPLLDNLNQLSERVGLGPMIADGIAGTAEHVDGSDGGWLLGDGGAGWSSTQVGVSGGDGGAAGIFGNGGAGGSGGADASGGTGGSGGSLMGDGGVGGHGGSGAVGGDGGDGGAAIGLFGVGGNGGDAGNGDADWSRSVLPALGGAGGNAGLLGSHGVVGHYGTLAGLGPGAGTVGLSTSGTWFTDSDGRAVILHGLNVVYKIPPFEPSASGFSDDDAAFLAANGFNVVRLGVIWAGVEPEPGVYNEAYLDSIAQTVQTLADHNIRVILDMHQDSYGGPFGGEGAPDWAVQDGGLPNIEVAWPFGSFVNPAENNAWDAFWSNAKAPDGVGLQNHYAQMWEYVANYVNGDPELKASIAGYEIMNEPWSGSSWPLCLLGCSAFNGDTLTSFYNQAASAIRAVDPNTPLFVEPELISGEALPITLGTVDGGHTTLSFHSYLGPLAGITVNNAAAYAQAQGIPGMLTEFGGTTNYSFISDTMQPANQARFGWTEWAYTGRGDITGWPQDEWLVQDPNQPPVGDNVDATKLATLAEPYPQLVSGTPISWSFENGTFHLSYSTEMASGDSSFPAGSQTTVSVPNIEFPNGYLVSVTGGHVVSAANSPILVIASDGGANTVSVTVSPAAGGATAGR